MKIVNVANDVSTAVANVNASDTTETNTKMMTAKMNTLPVNHECSKLPPMGRNLLQILFATGKDAESVSRNLLTLLVRFRYPLHDLSMQRNLRFWKSEFILCGGRDRICTFGKHSVLHISGLRAVLFNRARKSINNSCIWEKKKENKLLHRYCPLWFLRQELFSKCWMSLPFFFVLHLGATDHENYIFGGWFHANTSYRPPMTLSECHAQLIASPYRFHFLDPWDASRVDTMYGERMLSQPTMAAPDYPVPQRYVYKMHTTEMWAQQVPRYGLNALRLPKLPLRSTLQC